MNGAQFNGKGLVGPVSGYATSGMLGESAEGGSASSLVDPIQVVRRRLWVVALVAIAVAAAALGASLLQQPTYEASVKFLVGQEGGGDSVNLQNEVQGLQQISETMVEAVRTRPVAQEVIDKLGLQMTPEAFLRNLDAEQVGGTQFVEVSYKASDPEMAQRIANTVADTFSEQVSEVSPSASSITATVWERAPVPTVPVSPDPIRNSLLGLVLGIMLGLGLVFLLDHLDDDWKSPEEVEQIAGVPTFGVIPAFKVRKSKKKEG